MMNWHTFKNKLQAMLADRRYLLLGVLLSSLFLSLIACFFHPILSRDSALYMEVAKLSQTEGLHAVLKRFDWPWFFVFLGMLHHWTGIPLELIARLSGELMVAFACLISVDLVRKSRPDLGAWAALLVLAIPAFNVYRGDILREYGFWCFSMLALWTMSVWLRSQRWSALFLSGLAILLAAAFRFEAIYLVIAIAIMVPLRIQERKQSLRTIALCAALPILFVMSLLLALRYELLPPGRIAGRVAQLDVRHLFESFSVFAQQTAQAMPYPYAREDVDLIIFLGLCGYMLVKTLNTLGIFVIPWLIGWRQKTQETLMPWLLLDIAALGYVGILLIFVSRHFFLSQRYVSFLGFLFLPRIALGMSVIVQRWPKLKSWIVLVSIFLAFAHVVSLSPQKTHLHDAGLWLGRHVPANSRVYMDERGRLSLYAGRMSDLNQPTLEKALTLQDDEAYEYFAIVPKKHAQEFQIEGLKKWGLSPVAEFRNRAGDACVILRRDKVHY